MLNEKEVLTLREVAEYLGVHASTVYKYAKKGRIPAFKIGSDWRFKRIHIDEWIERKINAKDDRTPDNNRGFFVGDKQPESDGANP